MLPGFITKAKKSFHICSALSRLDVDIKNNSLLTIESYFSSNCIPECINELKIRYIRHTRQILTYEQIQQDKSPQFRQVAVSHVKDQSIIKKFLNDPARNVRLSALKLHKPCYSLLLFLEDPNWELRLVAIRKITDKNFIRKCENHKLHHIFAQVCLLITDPNVNVRIAVSKSLKNFRRINHAKIRELISKKDCNDNVAPGTFVHGFEDENEDVRINIIESISVLTNNNEMANETFDFLVDLLNDDVERVKEKAAFWMLRISEAFKVLVNVEMVDLIFCNFGERNIFIKDRLYEVVNHLYCNDSIVEYVYSKLKILLMKKLEEEYRKEEKVIENKNKNISNSESSTDLNLWNKKEDSNFKSTEKESSENVNGNKNKHKEAQIVDIVDGYINKCIKIEKYAEEQTLETQMNILSNIFYKPEVNISNGQVKGEIIDTNTHENINYAKNINDTDEKLIEKSLSNNSVINPFAKPECNFKTLEEGELMNCINFLDSNNFTDEIKKLFLCLKKLVKRNLSCFFSDLKKYKPEVLTNLYDINVFLYCMIIEELNEHEFDVEVEGDFNKYILFYKMKKELIFIKEENEQPRKKIKVNETSKQVEHLQIKDKQNDDKNICEESIDTRNKFIQFISILERLLNNETVSRSAFYIDFDKKNNNLTLDFEDRNIAKKGVDNLNIANSHDRNTNIDAIQISSDGRCIKNEDFIYEASDIVENRDDDVIENQIHIDNKDMDNNTNINCITKQLTNQSLCDMNKNNTHISNNIIGNISLDKKREFLHTKDKLIKQHENQYIANLSPLVKVPIEETKDVELEVITDCNENKDNFILMHNETKNHVKKLFLSCKEFFNKKNQKGFCCELFHALENFFFTKNILDFERLKILYGLEHKFSIQNIKEIKILCQKQRVMRKHKIELLCDGQIKKVYNLPLKLFVSCTYTIDCNDVYLLANISGKKVYYPLKNKITLFLYDTIDYFYINIIKKIDDKEVELIEKIKIIVQL
ncbi:Integrator complex subunit 4 [Conglomerata obtusa]